MEKRVFMSKEFKRAKFGWKRKVKAALFYLSTLSILISVTCMSEKTNWQAEGKLLDVEHLY